MKNRDENTTFIQLSYRTFTILKTFFNSFVLKGLSNKKAPVTGAFLKLFLGVLFTLNKTRDPARN
jgi:hypothetical protein